MNILVTGRGKSASWHVRGEQLGHAIGACVAPVIPFTSDVRKFDLAVVVKRPRHEMIAFLHHNKVRVIWDVVDSWPQPVGNDWNRVQCMAWLTAEIKTIRPAGIVAATEAMAGDCKTFGVPVLCVPHHVQPNLTRNPIRETVRIVGYDGGVQYLGPWHTFLIHECARRGVAFTANRMPAIAANKMSEMDIAVALRHQTGYAIRSWKSNVKLANAQGTGTPMICNREAGYLETRSGGEIFADTEAEVVAALDRLTDVTARRAASALCLAAAPTLARVAEKYKAWLTTRF